MSRLVYIWADFLLHHFRFEADSIYIKGILSFNIHHIQILWSCYRIQGQTSSFWHISDKSRSVHLLLSFCLRMPSQWHDYVTTSSCYIIQMTLIAFTTSSRFQGNPHQTGGIMGFSTSTWALAGASSRHVGINDNFINKHIYSRGNCSVAYSSLSTQEMVKGEYF